MDRVEPGQEFDVERLDCGDYRFVRRAVPRNEGAIDWLLACPHKGVLSIAATSMTTSVEPGIIDANILAYAFNADAPQHRRDDLHNGVSVEKTTLSLIRPWQPTIGRHRLV